MQNIIIRHAEIDDVKKVQKFISEQHWGEDYIFVKHTSFFEYEHILKNKFTFILAEYNNKICGILGYIVYNGSSNPDISAVMWKVIKTPNPVLGLELFDYLLKLLNPRIYIGVGANPKTTLALHKLQGYFTGKMNHYYRLSNKEKYVVSIINEKKISSYDKTKKYSLIPIIDFDTLCEEFDSELLSYRKPYKDMQYIKHRYFEHPVYSYKLFIIKNDNEKSNSILITREQEYNSVKVLRIIDFIGKDENLFYIGDSLQNLITNMDYEYVDFYEYGISDDIMQAAGFILRDDNDKNVIPTYFEPFVQKNIDIYFTSTDKTGNFYCFKGDADQDRPYVIQGDNTF